jgi:CRISP-associated protein Cas1
MHVDSRTPIRRPRVCRQCRGDIPQTQRRSAYCSYSCYLRWRDLHTRPLLGGGRPRRPRSDVNVSRPYDASLAPEDDRPLEVFPARTIADDADGTAWAARGAHWAERTAKADTSGAGRVLILSGHGVSLRLERGGLVVRSGFTYYPQRPVIERIFPADRSKPERIVVLDSDGSISFDVLRWCDRQGISVAWLNWQGKVTLLTAGQPTDVALIRAQVMMPPGQSLSIAQALVTEKVRTCAKTLLALAPSPAVFEAIRVQDEVGGALETGAAESVETLRLFEARAARAYFGAWRSLPLRWAGTRRHPIPQAWYSMDSRPSAITGTNRRATHPVNGILNYAYGVLEAEVRITVAAAGLDPTIGVLHASHPGRLALVYDLMEPLRPVIDSAVVGFLMRETLHPADFPMQEDGSCRLHPELARRIAALVRVDPMPARDHFVSALSRPAPTSVTRQVRLPR